MIDKSKIIEPVCERLDKLPIGHYLDLETYKRSCKMDSLGPAGASDDGLYIPAVILDMSLKNGTE